MKDFRNRVVSKFKIYFILNLEVLIADGSPRKIL